jgi:glycosyltransferase involved in cell wall biosynthesis
VTGRRALVCTYGLPEGDRDSGSQRILDHIDFLLDDGWYVDFFALNGAPAGRHSRALERRGVGVYDEAALSFEELLDGGNFHLALFAFWQTAERFAPAVRRLSPATHIVVDSVDLQFLRDARRAFSRSTASGRLLGPDYASEVIGELNVYAAADGVLTVSEKEAKLVDDFIGTGSLAWPVPDTEGMRLSELAFGERAGVVFVGSFLHPPNVAGVEFLCRNVLPLIDPELLRLHPVSIVGAGLDESVRRYAAESPHVRMIGWVPAIAPYLQSARVAVVPLSYGAGTKRKLLQALMAGTPTVSTTIGVEGVDVRAGTHVLVADDAEGFAEAVARLLVDSTLWHRLRRNGRRLVESLHSRDAVRPRFLAAIETTLARQPQRPLLPEAGDELYRRRLRYQVHQKIEPVVRSTVQALVPEQATVVVAAGDSCEFLALEGRTVWPFPRGNDGSYVGPPDSSADAIGHLEELRSIGADYLLVPHTALWSSLRGCPEFFEHVERRYEAVSRDGRSCSLFALSERAAGASRARRESRAAIRTAGGDRDALEEPGRLIAFYLPQFHPIPENDGWWSEGFTEWNHVAKAQPLFPGHYQPHEPADLGFYDLRLPETRHAQAELARTAGIHGFCYYHYWFHGKLLLERPFDEVLSSGEPDFPFCLCWANEPWSRRWHGREEDVLQPQRYSREDDLAHIRWLLPALADSRAIRIHDRPVFVVYQAQDLPDPARTVDTWRREADKQGLGELYLLTVETGWDEGWDATRVGFDAKVLFRPQFTILRNTPWLPMDGPESLEVHDYALAWPALAAPEQLAYAHYETVCPGWDNTPRVGERGVVLHNSTPTSYAEWLSEVLERTVRRPREERLVFVNAWNEWGEGCHLEPDRRYGGGYLDATRDALIACAARTSGAERSARISSLDDELATVAARRSKR